MTQKLYTKTWQNMGMDNQPIWVFKTPTPNGRLGNKVGDYVALSSDFRRTYNITLNDTAVYFKDFAYYVEDPIHWEDGNKPGYACREFIQGCEEVWFDGYATVWFKDIAENMMAMSKRFNYGWVIEEYSEDYEIGYRIYREDIAKKAHLEEDCVFLFTAEALVEYMADDTISKRCNFVKEEVIMIYPSGEFDEDMAYVVYHE